MERFRLHGALLGGPKHLYLLGLGIRRPEIDPLLRMENNNRPSASLARRTELQANQL